MRQNCVLVNILQFFGFFPCQELDGITYLLRPESKEGTGGVAQPWHSQMMDSCADVQGQKLSDV